MGMKVAAWVPIWALSAGACSEFSSGSDAAGQLTATADVAPEELGSNQPVFSGVIAGLLWQGCYGRSVMSGVLWQVYHQLQVMPFFTQSLPVVEARRVGFNDVVVFHVYYMTLG